MTAPPSHTELERDIAGADISFPVAVELTADALPEDAAARRLANAFRGASSLDLATAGEMYSSRRVPVLPVHRDNSPASEVGLPHGVKNATTKPRTVKRWFDHPQAGLIHGLAIATGSTLRYRLGLFPLDLDRHDGEHDGVGAWDELPEVRRLGWTVADSMERTLVVATPRTGRHILFWVPPGLYLPSTTGTIGPGIDTKGGGGYLVVTPTPGYRLLNDVPFLASVPDFLVGIVMEPERRARLSGARRRSGAGAAYFHTALADECAIVRAATEGKRHPTLLRAAGNIGRVLMKTGQNRDVGHNELVGAGLASGLPAPEVQRTVRDGLRWGMEHPAAQGPVGGRRQEVLDPPWVAEWRDWMRQPGDGDAMRRRYGRVCDVVLDQVMLHGSLSFSMAGPDLALAAGVSDRTARTHLNRLEGVFLSRVPGTGREATVYRLLPPPRASCPPTSCSYPLHSRSRAADNARENITSVSAVDWSDDAWVHKALGKSGPTVIKVLGTAGAASVSALSRQAGISWSTANRALKILKEASSVEQDESGRWWMNATEDAERTVAISCGTIGQRAVTLGKVEKRRAIRRADQAQYARSTHVVARIQPKNITKTASTSGEKEYVIRIDTDSITPDAYGGSTTTMGAADSGVPVWEEQVAGKEVPV